MHVATSAGYGETYEPPQPYGPTDAGGHVRRRRPGRLQASGDEGEKGGAGGSADRRASVLSATGHGDLDQDQRRRAGGGGQPAGDREVPAAGRSRLDRVDHPHHLRRPPVLGGGGRRGQAATTDP